MLNITIVNSRRVVAHGEFTTKHRRRLACSGCYLPICKATLTETRSGSSPWEKNQNEIFLSFCNKQWMQLSKGDGWNKPFFFHTIIWKGLRLCPVLIK